MTETLLFLAGVVARMAVVLVLLALLAWPALLIVAGRRLLRPAWQRLHGLRRREGVALRDGVQLAPNHTWLEAKGRDVVRVGVDDVARRLFRRPTRVTLARVGTRVHVGEVLAGVVDGDRSAQVLSPVDGTVRAANRELLEAPALVAADPYLGGWLLEVVADPGSLARVTPVGDAVAWLRREAARLDGLVEHELGLAAADGGAPHAPALDALTGEQWSRVASAVLRPEASVLLEQP